MGHLFSSPAPAPTPAPTAAPFRRLTPWPTIQRYVDLFGPCNGCPQDDDLDDDVSDNSLARNVDLNQDIFNGGESDNNYTIMIGGSWMEIMCICLIVLLCLNILCVSYNSFYGQKQKKVVHHVDNGGYTSDDDNIPFKNNA